MVLKLMDLITRKWDWVKNYALPRVSWPKEGRKEWLSATQVNFIFLKSFLLRY